MSRSARYAIGIVLVLALVAGGSGLAVAHWSQKESAVDVDVDAVVRGGACVVGELREVVRDVAGILSPDRDAEPDRDEPDRPQAGGATADSPLSTVLADGRDFFASLGDGVPRLDEGSSGTDAGC